MTFARTAAAGGNGNTTSTTVATSAYTSALGQLICGYVAWETGTTTVSISDTAGNTYVVGSPVAHANVDQHIAYFYCLSSKGHASNVVTATFGATRNYRGIQIAEYSKSSPAIADGNVYAGPTTTTTVTTGAITTTGASGVLFAGIKSYNIATITAGGSMTLIAQQGNYYGDSERILSSAAAYTATMNTSVSTSISCVAMAFREGESVTSITGSSVTEGSALRFTVTLSGTTGQTGDYTYSFGGTAVGVTDYDNNLANATFSAGASYVGGMIRVQAGYSSFTVDIPTVANSLDEADRTLILTVGGTASTGGTINDDDAAPTISVNDASENAMEVVFTVSLSQASGKSITVDYATANGTKSAGTDYTAASGTLTFAAGETTKTVTVSIL